MSIPVWTELVCCTCAETGFGNFVHDGRIQTRKLRADAIAQGWKFKHDDVFCSDECLKRYEDEDQTD